MLQALTLGALAQVSLLVSGLTNSLMPFAYGRGGSWAGVWTLLGFALAVLPR